MDISQKLQDKFKYVPDENKEILLVDYDGINNKSDFSEFKDHQFKSYEKIVKEIEKDRSWMLSSEMSTNIDQRISTMKSSHASEHSQALQTPVDHEKNELRIRERRKFYDKEEAIDRHKKYLAA